MGHFIPHQHVPNLTRVGDNLMAGRPGLVCQVRQLRTVLRHRDLRTDKAPASWCDAGACIKAQVLEPLILISSTR
jgi:hypothetical protein